MTNEQSVTIQIVVHNGEKHIRHCLDAVLKQSHPATDVIVLDNASTDRTADIVAREYPGCRLFRHATNLGMWPGQEHLLTLSTGSLVVALSVDVILDASFTAEILRAFAADERIGAVQGKLYQYSLSELATKGSQALRREIIDTCGFGMTRSRKVVNVGHGLPDGPAFSTRKDIFGVEGAVPVFRRSALQQCAVEGKLWDPDYFWYGDDFDMAWRMHLFGFRQVFAPDAVAWHDRSTTKGAADIPVLGQLTRRAQRAAIPLTKRRLDWSNVRFTVIKNDYIVNVLRDIPWIVVREVAVCAYTAIFEPGVFREVGRFIGLLPTMLRRRREVMRKATVRPAHIHTFFS